MRDARPDVVLVVGDDQGELFGPENFPAVSVYRGAELAMKPHEHLTGMPPWADRQFWSGYRMDLPHRYPGAPELGRDLVNGLIHEGVDVASSDRVLDPTVRGFGHAFGFVIERLMKGLDIPMLPVLLNTYFPPQHADGGALPRDRHQDFARARRVEKHSAGRSDCIGRP